MLPFAHPALRKGESQAAPKTKIRRQQKDSSDRPPRCKQQSWQRVRAVHLSEPQIPRTAVHPEPCQGAYQADRLVGWAATPLVNRARRNLREGLDDDRCSPRYEGAKRPGQVAQTATDRAKNLTTGRKMIRGK